MNATDQKLEEYLLGNFEVLPRDIVGVIVAQIDRKSLLDLCLSNKKFLGYCKSSKWFDKKVLQYIEESAPLSGLFRSLDEQATLIEKGFKSCYYAHLESDDGEEWNLVGLGFAAGDQSGRYHHAKIVKFEIVGLPPKKGTKVWLLAKINRETFDPDVLYPNEYSYIFLSKEEAVEHLRSSDGTYVFDVETDHADFATYDEMVDILIEYRGVSIQTGLDSHVFICLVQLSLP